MTKTPDNKSHGPLAGVRVLDMTTVQMGPLSTAILADMGADVVKVESPDGDISRNSVPFQSPGMGHSFLGINRNKRSVSLDLKQPEGKRALLALIPKADVLVYNVRPKAMARLGLSYEDVSAVNERIVYVGAFGFSERGRYAGRPAYDTMLQGMLGIPWMWQRASGEMPRYAPFSYCDQSSALHVVIAIVSALFSRSVTGRGQRVDVPMFENLTHVLFGEHLAGEVFVPPKGPVGYYRQMSRDRRPYQTKDGYICPFVYNDKQWRSFLTMIGQPEKFEKDERFSSHRNRVANPDVVYGFLAEVIQTRTSAEWLRLFSEHDLPIAPMNSLEDLLHDPHLADIGYFQTAEHPTEGTLRRTCYPTEFFETPSANVRPAPRLGEHTGELLAEAGFTQAEIDRMSATGAAKCIGGAGRKRAAAD